jgi:AcrR family transcriptional regulator
MLDRARAEEYKPSGRFVTSPARAEKFEDDPMRRSVKHNPDRRDERVQKVCEVAARLFNKKGYLETNMEGISAAAKLSKGGIYHYFSSKDEILFSIFDNYLNIALDGLEDELKGLKDISSKIKFVISRHISFYVRYPSEAKTLLHDAHCLPAEYRRTIQDKERQYFKIVSDLLSTFFGSKSGISSSQTTVMTFLLFGMCNWIYSWYRASGPVAPDELSEIIWTVFLGGAQKYSQMKK